MQPHWSLILAIVLPFAELAHEAVNRAYYEPARFCVAILGAFLLAHAWIIHVRRSRSRWQVALWTESLFLLLLGYIWLGLNVVRASTYPVDFTVENRLYCFSCITQNRILYLSQWTASLFAGTLIAFLVLSFIRCRRSASSTAASRGNS